MRILVDIDCVLADFFAGAAAAHGIPLPDVYAVWEVGRYGCYEPFGVAARGKPFTAGEFWAPISADPTFWETLPVLPWANDLLSLVRGNAIGDWWLVTSPSDCPECGYRKRRWVEYYFGPLAASRTEVVRNKYLLASPDTLLIDDYDENLVAFGKAGGRVLGFPAVHNSLHAFRHDPMSYVRENL